MWSGQVKFLLKCTRLWCHDCLLRKTGKMTQRLKGPLISLCILIRINVLIIFHLQIQKYNFSYQWGSNIWFKRNVQWKTTLISVCSTDKAYVLKYSAQVIRTNFMHAFMVIFFYYFFHLDIWVVITLRCSRLGTSNLGRIKDSRGSFEHPQSRVDNPPKRLSPPNLHLWIEPVVFRLARGGLLSMWVSSIFTEAFTRY